MIVYRHRFVLEKKAEIELIAQQERLRLRHDILESVSGHEKVAGERDVLEIAQPVGLSPPSIGETQRTANSWPTVRTAAQTDHLVDQIEPRIGRMHVVGGRIGSGCRGVRAGRVAINAAAAAPASATAHQITHSTYPNELFSSVCFVLFQQFASSCS